MKKNLLVFRRKNDPEILLPIFILCLIALSTLTFPITLDNILEKAKIDPDFAWDMYLSYISQLSPTISKAESEKIEKIGRILNAKRKLKEYDFALTESIPKLIAFLKSSKLSQETKFYILEIFGEDNLIAYLDENLSKDINTLLLLDIISIDTINGRYYSRVLDLISKDENKRNEFFEVVLKRIDNSSELTKRLLDELYSKYSESPKEYKEYREEIITLYNEFRAHNYKHTKFENIIAKQNSWYRKVLSFLSDIFNSLSPLFLELNFLIMLLLIIAVTILFSMPIVRYKILYALGLKKQAASTYRRIVDKDPLNEEKRLILAQLYEEAGMYEEAMNEYNFLKRIKIE